MKGNFKNMYNSHNIKIIESILAVYNTETLFLETVEVESVEWLVILQNKFLMPKNFFSTPYHTLLNFYLMLFKNSSNALF